LDVIHSGVNKGDFIAIFDIFVACIVASADDFVPGILNVGWVFEIPTAISQFLPLISFAVERLSGGCCALENVSSHSFRDPTLTPLLIVSD
jgi:hypothetical protein